MTLPIDAVRSMSGTMAFAILCADLDDRRKIDRSQITRLLGVPCQDAFISNWSWFWMRRASIRYASFCEGLPVTGHTLRGLAIGAESEVTFAKHFAEASGTVEAKGFLVAAQTYAFARQNAVASWYLKRGAPPFPQEAAEPQEEPEPRRVRNILDRLEENPATSRGINLQSFYHLPPLIDAGILSEGDAQAVFTEQVKLFCRFEVQGRVGFRDALQLIRDDATLHCLEALEMPGLDDDPKKRIEFAYRYPHPEALPFSCPVCGYGLAARKSLFMEMGINQGSASCLACSAHLRLRTEPKEDGGETMIPTLARDDVIFQAIEESLPPGAMPPGLLPSDDTPQGDASAV